MSVFGRTTTWALCFIFAGSCTLAVDGRQLAAECSVDDECNDGDACNGEETCDTDARRCVEGTALTCADGDDCTTDACDPDLGCTAAFYDVDGDGFSPATCDVEGEYAAEGGDCDDTNSSRRPGAPEQCNTSDDDCDETVDEEVVSIPCYRDRDDDGYPSNAPADIVMNCQCPAGYVPGRTDGLFDCPNRDGTDATTDFTAYTRIHPNPVASAQHFCVNGTTGAVVMSVPFEEGGFICAAGTGTFSYDYDCSGTDDRTYTTIGSGSGCTGAGLSCTGSGWVAASVPNCGVSGSYRSCRGSFVPLGCSGSASPRAQTCK